MIRNKLTNTILHSYPLWCYNIFNKSFVHYMHQTPHYSQ